MKGPDNGTQARFRTQRIVVLALVCCVAGLVGCQGQYPPRCSYEASVAIDASCSHAASTVSIVYRNDGPSVLRELVFHFDSGASRNPPQFVIGEQPVSVVPWVENGRPRPNHYVVTLSEPLPPGRSLQMRTFSRSSVQDHHGIVKFLAGCWHPKILHREGEQWLAGIDEFATYQLTIGGVRNPTIPASGKLISRTKREDGNWNLTFRAADVPDFAMVFTCSDHMISAVEDDVLVQCFYMKDKEAAERTLKAARQVLTFYRKMYGFYPADVLNLIAFDLPGSGGFGFFGGYPIGSNIVRVNNTFAQSEPDTIWAVAHEIGHEYWGWKHVIDANQEMPWLCLGLGLWSDEQFMEANGIQGQNTNILSDYIEAAEEGLDTRLMKVSGAIPDQRMDENALAHSKGYWLIKMLEYLHGRDAMLAIARTTLTECAHRPLRLEEFQRICERTTRQNLDWFFDQWVRTNEVLDYGIADMKEHITDAGHQLTVTLDRKGGIAMPMDVLLEFADGSKETRRVPIDTTQCRFTSRKQWYRVIVDPAGLLPVMDRENNIKLNPEAPPVFQVLHVDTGDKAWGQNVLKVHVKNMLNVPRSLYVHIGGRAAAGQPGFGMGEIYTLEPEADIWIEHPYWIPPSHGTGQIIIRFTDPVSEEEKYMGGRTHFLVRTEELAFQVPNYKCNNLKSIHKKDAPHIEPFQVFLSDHFVLYCSPNTPAFDDVPSILSGREASLRAACDFAGVEPKERIVVFLYPDGPTKYRFTVHHGDGLAWGSTIAEVYNETVKLDPAHEIAHVVMAQVGDPPALFSEGFATRSQAGQIWNGKPVNDTARELLKAGKLPDLATLLTREEIGSHNDDGDIAYPVSASFVDYLIRTFGRDHFLAAYRQLQNGSEHQETNLQHLRTIYGLSLQQLEEKWLEGL